ncbi:hypothetical protein AAFC00_003166 [Neodothiora populina]
MASNKTGVEKKWTGFGSSDYAMVDDLLPHAPEFTCPSYLRTSRYAERLAEEHRSAIDATRESRRRGRHVYYSNDNPPSASLSASSSSANLQKLPTSYLRTHDHIDRLPTSHAEEPLKKLPTVWSDTDKCSGLEVLNGGSEVRFAGQTKTSDEAAAIRSDHPIPKEVGLFYFEVTILSRGKEGLIGIGFSNQKANLNRLPGWEPESWAYHGDDGYSFACTASGKQYGPKFSSLDVIGCGVNFKHATAFFTKNGQFLGEAFHNIKIDNVYPSVGMKRPGEHLRVNFGATPFVFDIDAMMKLEKSIVGDEINRTSVASLEPHLSEGALIQELIAQYLAHDGYVETARAFADEVHGQRQSLSGDTEPLRTFDPSQDVHAINRQRIRAAILDGDIDKALKYISTYYPHVLERVENRDVYFKLRCRKFIEMMRRSTEMGSAAASNLTPKSFGKTPDKSVSFSAETDLHMDIDDHYRRDSRPPVIPPLSVPAPLDPNMISSNEDTTNDSMDTPIDQCGGSASQKSTIVNQHSLLSDALDYGRELRREFSGDSRPAVQQALQDTFALLAYTDARDSVVGGLMEGKGRIEIAEEVNAAILISLGKPSSAALENLCAQAEVLVDMLSAEGGSGAFVNVSKDCFH